MKEAKYHIENNSVQETLIIPLFGRKVCSEHFPDLFRDEEAERICAGLDYDFAAKQKKMESKVGLFGALEVAQRNDFTFGQFFLRFFIITTAYKLCDMILVDYFLLLKFGFFQYYYPEAGNVMENRKYGFNIKSQLLKLLVIFPAISALLSWI